MVYIVIGNKIDSTDEEIFRGEDGIVEGERLKTLKYIVGQKKIYI